jgi:hypothetical protein
MNIIPAIDLLDGEAVRLYQGNYQDVRSYSSHPAELALRFGEQGARYLHLVDLDAARYKSSDAGERRNNRDQIKAICRESSLEIEVGGGVRSDEDVKELIDLGVKRLIVGTLLVKTPILCRLGGEIPGGFHRRHRCQGRRGEDFRLGGRVQRPRRRSGRGGCPDGHERNRVHEYFPGRNPQRTGY